MNELDMNDLINEEENMSLFQKIINIIIDPKKSFNAMKSNPKILGVFLLTLILAAIPIIWNTLDGTTKELMIQQLQAAGQPITDKFLKISTIGGLVGGIALSAGLPFLVAFFYHIVSMIQSHTGYKKTLLVYLYSSIISHLSALISLVVLKLTGTSIVFSPAMFIDSTKISPILYTLLASLNLFTFWSMVVMFIGFKSIHDMNKKEATITVLAPYIISIILGIIIITVVQG